jgi:hypothetical protein
LRIQSASGDRNTFDAVTIKKHPCAGPHPRFFLIVFSPLLPEFEHVVADDAQHERRLAKVV